MSFPDATAILIEAIPLRTPFGLDQIRYSWKTNLTAEAAIAACDDVGTAHPSFPFMFLMPITTPESSGASTRVDLVYMGCLRGTSEPTLPDRKHDSDDSVQSASSSRFSTGLVLTQAANLQYYAPSNTISYLSFGAIGTDVADDPSGTPVPIVLTCGDATFVIGTVIQETIDNLFSPFITHSFKSTEIVPGKYWQNISTKTKVYMPWLFDLTAGAYVTLYSPGNNYLVGDILTIYAGGESATIQVTGVGGVLGGSGITLFTVTANTFTSSHNSLPASGGSGTGAGFNVIIIT